LWGYEKKLRFFNVISGVRIKKLGLTALAGSLVATSAYAGSLDVSGTAKLTYVSQDADEVTGNPFSNSQGIGFSGSGDLDNGMTIKYGYTMTNAAFSSSTLKLDMGDAGELSYADSASPTGISAYDDVMPTAGEEVWDDVAGEANGVAVIENDGTLGYKGTFGGIGISASFNADSNLNDGAAADETGGSSYSVVLTSGDLIDGVELGYGIGSADTQSPTGSDANDLNTIFAKYTMGAITMGAQYTSIDKSGANSDIERMHYAVSMAINENLSASIGSSTVDFDNSAKSDQENTGIAVSYTMGSMTLSAFQNNEDSSNGSAGSDDKVSEISLAFAF
jgi:outer membrane protein OmpU